MNQSQKFQYRKAFKEFVDLDKFKKPFSVTLTMKQSMISTQGDYPVHIRITKDRAVQNFRHFMNLLNTRVYGKSFRRHGNRIQVVPFMEGGDTTRLHYHCIIDCPKPTLDITFPSLIESCWYNTDYGYHQIDIQPHSDAGWLNYISKFRGKTQYDQSIDWTNFHQD